MKLKNYGVMNHGLEHSQYWRGHGTSFTPYTHSGTGIGGSFWEAFQDALEQLASDEDVSSDMLDKIESEIKSALKESGEWEKANRDLVSEEIEAWIESEGLSEEEAEEYSAEADLHYYVSVDLELGE